jgi:hypothetical protein
VQRSGSVTVSIAAASTAAVLKLLLLLLLLLRGPVLLCWPTSSGTYRLASCGTSHRLRLLLSKRLHQRHIGQTRTCITCLHLFRFRLVRVGVLVTSVRCSHGQGLINLQMPAQIG